MLTGELPRGKFQPPSRKVLVDVRLDEVVLRAMEREPWRRYQHVSEVGARVETIVATLGNARQAVKAPAIGMVVAAGISMASVIIWATLGALHGAIVPAIGTGRYLRPDAVVSSGLVAVCIAGFILWAALGMMQLRRRRCAIAASILATCAVPASAYSAFVNHWLYADAGFLMMMVVPSVIVGLPAGIWALVVLSRREMIEAFAARRAANRPVGGPAPSAGPGATPSPPPARQRRKSGSDS